MTPEVVQRTQIWAGWQFNSSLFLFLDEDANCHLHEHKIIERGWAKYLSLASSSILCRSRRLRQIIDLQDTDKSGYFAITKFNNCLIKIARGTNLQIFTEERGFKYAWAGWQWLWCSYYVFSNNSGTILTIHVSQDDSGWTENYLLPWAQQESTLKWSLLWF